MTSRRSIGYRFHPTDEELVNYYLKLKMLGNDQEVSKYIAEVEVCKFEPWELCEQAVIKSNDPVWYFFSPPDYYNNSQRAKRTTRAGYWKSTGKDRKVTTASREEIATKKTLVYYEGRVPNGRKTNWIMHEYTPIFRFPNQRDFVLCKLKTEADEMPAFEEGQSSSSRPSNSQNYAQEEDTEVQAHLTSFNGYDERDYSLNSALQTPTYPEGSYYDYGGYGASASGYGQDPFCYNPYN